MLNNKPIIKAFGYLKVIKKILLIHIILVF